MPISVITFDLDNTLWDVEPALIKAEQAQQDWLLQHRPGAVEAYDFPTHPFSDPCKLASKPDVNIETFLSFQLWVAPCAAGVVPKQLPGVRQSECGAYIGPKKCIASAYGVLARQVRKSRPGSCFFPFRVVRLFFV